tara:strand:- start:2214 stop:2432 length:219 start_codon:yes stop_codon:yes gene_type:complete
MNLHDHIRQPAQLSPAEELQLAFMDDDDPDSEWHMGDTAVVVALALVIVSLALVGLWTVCSAAAAYFAGCCA